MKLYGFLFALSLSLLFAGCMSVSMKNADGTTMSGSMMNGSISYSVGPACTPAQPSSIIQPPSVPATPMTVKQICEGSQCVHVMMADPTPQCVTQVATVRGVDFSTYAAWALGTAFAVWALVK